MIEINIYYDALVVIISDGHTFSVIEFAIFHLFLQFVVRDLIFHADCYLVFPCYYSFHFHINYFLYPCFHNY